MTDMKKCGTFLVKIDSVDGECTILRERPSDALVLSLLDLIPPSVGQARFRLVLKGTDVILNLSECSTHQWVIDGWVSYPRRFTRLAPHRLLKRRVMEGFGFRVNLESGPGGELVSHFRSGSSPSLLSSVLSGDEGRSNETV
jgi:hypothetical protein